MNIPKPNQKLKMKTDNDLDGMGCALVAMAAFGERIDIQHCTIKNVDHSITQFLKKDKQDDTFLFITDMAVNPENKEKLEQKHQKNQSIQLIDHHEKNISFHTCEWGWVQVMDENNKRTCATSLFYTYLVNHGFLQPDPLLEEVVELVRLWDTWDWFRENKPKAKQLNDLLFILGVKEFKETIFPRLLPAVRPFKSASVGFDFTQDELNWLLKEQKKINAFVSLKERQLVVSRKQGMIIGIVYTEQYHSELGNELANRHPHLDIIVMVNVGGKKVSYRTIHPNVDVNEFSSFYGGGGHKESAGSALTLEAFTDFVTEAFHKPSIPKEPELNKFNVKQSPYGSFFQNASGEQYYIRPEKDRWSVCEAQDTEQCLIAFPSFLEAERFVKREFDAYLTRDDAFITFLSHTYSVKEATLRSKFHLTMEQAFRL